MKQFIYSASVASYIGILLTITKIVFGKMDAELRRGDYMKKDQKGLKSLSDRLGSSFAGLARDIIRDNYPSNSVISLDDTIKHLDTTIILLVKDLTYSVLKELKEMRDNANLAIEQKTIDYHNKIDEIYGVSAQEG